MVAALPIALAAGGVAGSIFGRKSAPTFDPSQLYGFINQGAQEQKNYAGQLVPGVNANNAAFKAGITGAENTATSNLAQQSKDYLSQLDPTTSRILAAQTGQLKQNIFGQLPEETNAAREAAAASGGLNRGAATAQIAQVPIKAAEQFNTGVTGLNTQALQAKQGALANIYTTSAAQTAQKLGIDQNTYNAILNSGNDALKQQLADLIQISQNQTGQLVGVGEAAAGANIARGAADAQAQNAVFNALTGTGGTLLGLDYLSARQPTTAPTTTATPVPPVQTDTSGLYSSGALQAPTGFPQGIDPITLQYLLAQQANLGSYQAPQ